MDSITVFYYFKVLSFSVFFIVSIFIFIEFLRKRNKILILFFSLSFIVFIINLFSFFEYPSIAESRGYINKFENLKIEEIEEIVVTIYILNSKPTKLNRTIRKDSEVSNIVNVLRMYNKTSSFSFKDWNPTIAYKIFMKSKNGDQFLFDIIETETDLSVVNLIFKNKQSFYNIGQYSNNNIEQLKIHTLGL